MNHPSTPGTQIMLGFWDCPCWINMGKLRHGCGVTWLKLRRTKGRMLEPALAGASQGG